MSRDRNVERGALRPSPSVVKVFPVMEEMRSDVGLLRRYIDKRLRLFVQKHNAKTTA